ncbi:adenylyltransferase/cytidyltransferase family protein [Gammaproteobacteria bacterium]|nr:adenylyltransferase/cytidyltransferase family protein [Gammaproteobacteria bacterium]
MKIVVVSGGFDPIHSGHIEYFKAAKLLGNKLVVAVNSDQWLIDKKGKFFMPFSERANIISNLGVVDEVIDFEDDEYGSCALGLKKIKIQYPDDDIIFCNGGDRKKDNIPEMSVKDIIFKFSVGGNDKLNSSSTILKNWNYDSEKRVWGKFYNLFVDKRLKLKELIVEPNKGMSFQRHFKRNEIWFISKGSCEVRWSETAPENKIKINLETEEVFHVKVGNWHQIINPFDVPCHIIEIQYGEETDENDIERLSFFEGN